MIKACMFGLVAIIIAICLKSIKNEYGIFAGICGSIILVYMILTKFSGILDLIKDFEKYVGSAYGYIDILIKMLGIALIAEITSNLCRDTGYSGIASHIELIGKLSILLISAPIIHGLLDTIFGIM